VHLKAILHASIIEYPRHVADVLYVGACNFRCPFCYNVDLVTRPNELPDLATDQVLRDLQARARFIDGVVVTGGEPTLQDDLLEFLSQLRATRLAVKLDTNGYRPDVLRECLAQGLADYVAMDVKSSPARYAQAAGVPVDWSRVRESIDLLLGSQMEYEFRTTVVPGLVETEDVQAIAQAISGARCYVLQAFRPTATLAWGPNPPVAPPTLAAMRALADLAAGYVHQVELRGIAQTSVDCADCTDLGS
jgi:pyruvate formate lyase activating enzyme